MKRLLPLLLVAAVFRCWDLGHHSLWLDELFSIRVARREDLSGLMEELSGDVHPPLYFLLLRGWLWVCPWAPTDAWVRLPGALFGVASVGVAAKLGKKLGSGAGAWLYALAPFAIGLEREARGNSLATLESLLLMQLMWDGLQKPGRWPWAWALVATALLYTHPFAPFLLLSSLLYLLATTSRHLWRPWLEATLFAGIAWLPWLKILLHQMGRFSASPWYLAPAPDVIGWLLPALAGGVGLAALLAMGVAMAPEKPIRSWVMAHMVGLLLLPWIVSQGWAPVLRDRNVAALLPLWCLWAGMGWRGRGLPIVASFFAVASYHALRLAPPAEQWREAAAQLQAGFQAGDRIFANDPWLWRWYLPDFTMEERATEIPTKGRLWILQAHGETAAPPEPLQSWNFVGASLRLYDFSRHTLPFPEGLGSPLLTDGVLHLYWNQRLEFGDLSFSGRCRILIEGWGDAAGGEPALLQIGVGAQQLGLSLPTKAGEVATEEREITGTFPLSVAFVNDAQVGEEDRNAHLSGLAWRCE